MSVDDVGFWQSTDDKLAMFFTDMRFINKGRFFFIST